MTATEPQKPIHLSPSQLGTKEYWDNLYTTELSNHSLDPSDEGTIWFDDSLAEDKSLVFLEDQILHHNVLGEGIGKENWRENCSFLDLGTGNGHFLFRLREGDEEEEEEEGEEGENENGKGWNGRMLGVDYSQKSIEFAQRIAADKMDGKREVEFLHWDIMTSSPTPILSPPNAAGWDVVLDKGTFDAISLSEEVDEQGRRICEGYKDRVVPLMRKGGIFLVTSCNWTEEELEGWFVGGELERVGGIGYKSFSFGGKKGQTVCSVCFRRT